MLLEGLFQHLTHNDTDAGGKKTPACNGVEPTPRDTRLSALVRNYEYSESSTMTRQFNGTSRLYF